MKAILIKASGESGPVEIKGKTFNEQTKALQEAIGRRIETIALSPECLMIVDREGRLKGLPENPKATQASSMNIVGDALVCGIDGEEFTDVPDHIERLLYTLFGIGGRK